MMIDIDEDFSIGDAPSHFAEPVEARGIGCNNTVKLDTRFGLSKKMLWIEKLVLLRQSILIPADYLLALGTKSKSEPELRANAIAIWTNMSDDAKRPMFANDVENLINDFRMWFHEK